MMNLGLETSLLILLSYGKGIWGQCNHWLCILLLITWSRVSIGMGKEEDKDHVQSMMGLDWPSLYKGPELSKYSRIL